MTDPLKIETTVEIRRPVSDVFKMWSTAELLGQWFAPMSETTPIITMEFAKGGEYEINIPMNKDLTITTRGRYIEIVPNECIVMTWRCSAFPDPETTVTVRFEETDSGTRIRLTHERFDNQETCSNHTAGWDACLSALDRILGAGHQGIKNRIEETL